MRLLSSVTLPALLITIIILSLPLYAQNTNNDKIKFLSCIDDKKDFEIQGQESAELKMIYTSHMLFFHNRTLTEKEIDSLMNTQIDKIADNELRSIMCRNEDDFVIRSADETELLFWMGDHMKLVHDREMTDDELKKIIK
jgi:predicted small metal-binding protein